MFSITNDNKLLRYLNTANVKGVIIPESIKELTGYSFHNKDSKGVRFVWIPNHITEIPDHCFEGSDVEFVRISPQTKRIGDCAFRNCRNLVSVKVPDGCSLGTKRSGGGWANSETVFEGCPKIRTGFQPWIDSMLCEYADKRYATSILFEGGFLAKSANRTNFSDDFVSDKGFYLVQDTATHFYYRVMDLNPKPTPRAPGKYTVKTRMIYV